MSMGSRLSDLIDLSRRFFVPARCSYSRVFNAERFSVWTFLNNFKPAFLFFSVFITFTPETFPVDSEGHPSAWEKYLHGELESLRKEIAEDPRVISWVLEANAANMKLSGKQIQVLDKNWIRTEGVDLFISTFLTNGLAETLKEFQRNHRSLVEIFMTDERGNLIGSTNKTSDYYQGDEAWWQEAKQSRNPAGFLGRAEYDESAFAYSVALYLPVFDTDRQKVIGVVKAVSSRKKVQGLKGGK